MGASGNPGILRALRRAAVRRGARRAAALALAAGLLLAGVGGCGKREPARQTVVLWQFSPLGAIQPILDRFAAENPELDVRVEQLTWQSGREKIVAAVAAGRPPDLCELGSTFLPGLVADSTLLDLTDSVRDLADSLLGWDIVRYRGRAWAVPWLLGTRALYYNRDLLRRAGLNPSRPPTTWEELYRAARHLDRAASDGRGFGMNAGEREILFKKFMPFAWGKGAAS